MARSTKALAVCTLVALVAVTVYTVALGSDGRLWFGWAVLGAVTAASALGRAR